MKINKKTIIFLISLVLIFGTFVITIILNRNIFLEKRNELKNKISVTTFTIPTIEKKNEIFLLKNGDIYLLKSNLEIEKITEIPEGEKIKKFKISPSGETFYWINEKGELWKKEKDKDPLGLITREKDMKEQKIERDPFFIYTDLQGDKFYIGEVKDFWISPDEKYLVYEAIEAYGICCCSEVRPIKYLRVVKSDGSEKFDLLSIAKKIEGKKGYLVNFIDWLPNTHNFILSFYECEFEPVDESIPYKFDIDKKIFEIYTEIYPEIRDVIYGDVNLEKMKLVENLYSLLRWEETGDVFFSYKHQPNFSQLGNIITYIKGNKLEAKNIKTQETKVLIEDEKLKEFDVSSPITIWSKDDDFFVIIWNNKIYLFNKDLEKIKDYSSPYSLSVIGFSNDKKYFAAYQYLPKTEELVIFLIDLSNPDFESKTFSVKLKESNFSIESMIFSPNNSNLFYILSEGAVLYKFDLTTQKIEKILENVSQIVPAI